MNTRKCEFVRTVTLCCERGRKRELILSFHSGLRRLCWVWIPGKAWCIVERKKKMLKRSASMTLVFMDFLKLLSAPNHLTRHRAQKVMMAAVQWNELTMAVMTMKFKAKEMTNPVLQPLMSYREVLSLQGSGTQKASDASVTLITGKS